MRGRYLLKAKESVPSAHELRSRMMPQIRSGPKTLWTATLSPGFRGFSARQPGFRTGSRVAGRLSPSAKRLPPSAKRLSSSAITCHRLPGPATFLRSARRPPLLMDRQRYQSVCSKVLAASEVQADRVRSPIKLMRDRRPERGTAGTRRPVTVCHIAGISAGGASATVRPAIRSMRLMGRMGMMELVRHLDPISPILPINRINIPVIL